MQKNIQDEGFIYENDTILCMACNVQEIYRGRKMITHWGMEENKKNMELSNQKGSRYCATVSKVLGNRNEAIDSGVSFPENIKK